MCGIMAKVGKYNNVKKLNKMLCALEVRGDHSTGILSINKRGEVRLLKDTIPASQFVKKYKKELKEIWNMDIVIAHTRWATQGDVTWRNAHPFIVGKFAVVHNGSVFGYNDLFGEVDSEQIALALDEKGFEGLKQIGGAMAILVIDMSKKELVVYKQHNPLFRVKLKKGMVFASTNNILSIVQSGRSLEYGYIYRYNIDGKLIEEKQIKEIYATENYAWRYWDDGAYGAYYGAYSDYDNDNFDDNSFYATCDGCGKLTKVNSDLLCRDCNEMPLFGSCEICGNNKELEKVWEYDLCHECFKKIKDNANNQTETEKCLVCSEKGKHIFGLCQRCEDIATELYIRELI